MTSLKDMEPGSDAGSELEIYETVGGTSSSESEAEIEKPNESIITSGLTRDAALEAFVDMPRRTDDSIPLRVARIRREIEELRRQGAEVESSDLLSDLKGLMSVKSHNETPVMGHPFPQAPSAEASAEFAALEKRISAIEASIGLSARSVRPPVRLASSLAQLSQTVELLASNPERVNSNLARLEQLKGHALDKGSTRIDSLYDRLNHFDGAIEALPQIVSRLQSLRHVHAQAVNYNHQIEELALAVDSMQGDLKSWRDLLETLEARVSDYITVSNNNVAKLRD